MKLLLVGAGGHARTIAATAADNGHILIAYVARTESSWLVLPRYTDDDDAAALECDGFVLGLGGVDPGRLQRRLALFRRYQGFDRAAVRLVHSRAWVAPGAVLGSGVTVLAGAIVNAAARIQEAAIVNTGAIVEHDSVVGAGAHVAPGAIVLGATAIGEAAMIGAGAVILPDAVVPAGAAIPALTRYPC